MLWLSSGVTEAKLVKAYCEYLDKLMHDTSRWQMLWWLDKHHPRIAKLVRAKVDPKGKVVVI